MPDFIHSKDLHAAALKVLAEQGVTVSDIAKLTYFLESDYISGLTEEQCAEHVQTVLSKHEVQNALLTGIEMDRLAQQKQLSWPLQHMVEIDESLYGIDEILAMSILNVYGTIGYTNYGYIDKLKHGILERLNDKSTGEVHTFLDDLVAAVAAAAASRVAHHHREQLEQSVPPRTTTPEAAEYFI